MSTEPDRSVWILKRPTLVLVLTVVINTMFSIEGVARTCAEGVFAARVVAIHGRQLQPLLGEQVSQLRMWGYKNEERIPIPFQVDACGADGRLLMSTPGETSTARSVGEQSLLLFLARDAGERKRGPVSSEVAEIELGRPGGDGSRWAYVGRSDDGVAISPHDYVAYDARSDTVYANRYTVRFRGAYADFFSIRNAPGADTENLIDRWKIRIDAQILWGLIRFRRNEEHVTERVIAYVDGPIRVVRRSRLETKVGWGISSPEAVADEYFYGDHYGGPSEIRIPFQLSRVFGDVEVRIYLDFRNLDGFKIIAGGSDAAVVVRPSPDDRLEDSVPQQVSWLMATRGDLGFLHRLRLGPTLDGIKSGLFYSDEARRADPPEAVLGLRPGIGYRLTDWASVGRGRHEIWTETYVIDPAQFAKPDAALERLTTPLSVKVHPASPSSDRPTAGR